MQPLPDRKSLDALIQRARDSGAASPEQASSFVWGNANVEGDALSRQTVTRALHPGAAQSTDDATAGAVAQYALVFKLVQDHTGPNAHSPFLLTPAIIKELHRAAFPSDPDAGAFRSTSVEVAGTPHAPPAPDEIAGAISSMCDVINEQLNEENALTCAAFVLWRLNWIHPFADGNGRTSRALSYCVLSIGYKTLLPGEHTIPEQLRNRRQDYVDALEAADAAYRDTGEFDVSVLRELLASMLQRQLSGGFAVPAGAADELELLVKRRIAAASSSLQQRAYDTAQPRHCLWSERDILILQVGSDAELETASRRQATTQQAFPALLTTGDDAQFVMLGDDKGRLFVDGRFVLAQGERALGFHRGAAAIIVRPSVKANECDWSTKGTLYALRFGLDISPENFVDVLDLLIARHLSLVATP